MTWDDSLPLNVWRNKGLHKVLKHLVVTKLLCSVYRDVGKKRIVHDRRNYKSIKKKKKKLL